ncbi:MAG TPA: hypothetical protein VFO40_15670 [Chthoniobacterales bacterium]|nr:hypothetical protein [Chthoniobacterales bacterium]
MSSEPSAVETPVSPTVPVNPEPSNQSDPAFVPSPHQQQSQTEEKPWMTDEFKKKVAAAGFPGSPQTDEASLMAFYRFGGGTIPEPAPPAEQTQSQA